MQMLSSIASNEEHQQKDEDATDREDELKRDKEQEIFKVQANQIKNKLKKKKDGDVIDVTVERTSNTSRGFGDVFSGSQSRLQFTKEQEKIVGYAKPIGKFTQILLGQKLSQIANMMKNSNPKEGYWTSYINARKQADAGITSSQAHGQGR